MRISLTACAVIAAFLIGWIGRGVLEDRAAIRPPAEIAGVENVPLATPVQARHQTDVAFLRDIESLTPGQRRDVIETWASANDHTFDTLMALTAASAELGQIEAAFDQILDAAIAAETPADQALLEAALATLTRDHGRQLIAANRFDALDRMYERITLALPELSGYFMELGELRLRLGNVPGALSALAQIQNDAQLGARVRELMAQAEASEAVEASDAEELPLTSTGSQFIVEASLNDGHPVALLVDTGAAMTVIRAETLARIGYSLSGQKELFATAGGVVEAPVVMLESLTLGNATIHQLPVGALVLEMPGGIDGLLGMNFLRHFEFRIDQEAKVLFLDSTH